MSLKNLCIFVAELIVFLSITAKKSTWELYI